MLREEKKRLVTLTKIETEARKNGYLLIAGVDEAGRGPLAGPVVAAACIIPPRLYIQDVNDSKQLSPNLRERVFKQLTTHPEILYSVGIVDVEVIDQINILQATKKAMLMAIEGLQKQPDLMLVDGFHLDHPLVPCEKVIHGDALSQSIAAASIIAKEVRDALMREMDLEWPEYGFKNHKGYGTRQHLMALAKHGPCPYHRRTFEPIKSALGANHA